MTKNSIKRVAVYYSYWSDKSLFGRFAYPEDCLHISVTYYSGKVLDRVFGGEGKPTKYDLQRLPLAGVSTLPKSVQHFITEALCSGRFEYSENRDQLTTPYDKWLFLDKEPFF